MDYERQISQEAKSNPKRFWQYLRRILKTRTGIADLLKSPGDESETLTTNDQEKAEVLSGFFSSVFTVEPEGYVPKPKQREYDMPLTDMESTPEERNE